MREDRNPQRQNQSNPQECREELDQLEFGNDFFDDLPDWAEQADQTVTRDRNLNRNNNRTK